MKCYLLTTDPVVIMLTPISGWAMLCGVFLFRFLVILTDRPDLFCFPSSTLELPDAFGVDSILWDLPLFAYHTLFAFQKREFP